jgi:hypothetical protein
MLLRGSLANAQLRQSLASLNTLRAGGKYLCSFSARATRLLQKKSSRLSSATSGKYNLVLSVMHPLLCLQEKLAASIGLSQEDRQDVKHLRMCMEFVPLFIADRIKDSAPREVLRMCQHILKLAQSTHGRSAFKRFGIEIEKAIPIFHLRRSRVPCLTRFCSEQLPRAVSTIQKRRA